MKTFEQLAESAFNAYFKQAEIEAKKANRTPPLAAWMHINQKERECWVAAVKQVSAEIAALH